MAVVHDGRTHGGRRSLLVHDEMGGNESLCNRVHRQPQPFQSVGSQQSRGVVLSEHDESDLAGAFEPSPKLSQCPSPPGDRRRAGRRPLSIGSIPSSRRRLPGNVV